MRDTHCHARAINSIVVTSRDTLEIDCWTFRKICRHMTRALRYFTWPASPRIPAHTVTSSSVTGAPNCVPWCKPLVVPVWGLLNPLECRGNYSVTSNDTKLVHRQLMGRLLGPHLVQRGRAWAGCGPAPPRCTNNSNGQSTNRRITV